MKTKTTVILVSVGGGLLLLLYYLNKAKNINKGTPYEGYGVVGTLGNLTNQASGGTLSKLGDWLGGKIFTAVNGEYDPNAAPADRSTPAQNPGVVSNPVSPSPSILQYSYKQANVDNPSLLGTTTLFTPGDGSSGAYTDNSSFGAGDAPTSTSYDSGTTTTWN